MSVYAIKSKQAAGVKSGNVANSPKQKTMKLVYYYEPGGKQLGHGDYYTPDIGISHNVYSYESLSNMSDKELKALKIRKEVREFTYTPEPPAPPKEKNLLDKIREFIGI